MSAAAKKLSRQIKAEGVEVHKRLHIITSSIGSQKRKESRRIYGQE
jgi:hypothetical protein